MKPLLSLALLWLLLPPAQTTSTENSVIEIVSLTVKEKVIRPVWHPSMINSTPPELKPELGRGADRNEPEIQKIHRDTSQRMSELRGVETKARQGNDSKYVYSRPETEYEFRVSIKNSGSRQINGFLWAYRYATDQNPNGEQELLCNVKIEPGVMQRVKVKFSVPWPRVVNATGPKQKPTLNDLAINQVTFADGTVWRRANLNPETYSEYPQELSSLPAAGKCIALRYR
jgi:hypothetical protein